MCDLILLEQAVRQNIVDLEERFSVLILRFTALHYENDALKEENYNFKDEISALTAKFEVFRRQGSHVARDQGRTTLATDSENLLASKLSTPSFELQTEKDKNAVLEAQIVSLTAQVPKRRLGGLGMNGASFQIATDSVQAEGASQNVGRSLSRARNSNSLLPGLSSPEIKRFKKQESTSKRGG